MNDSDFSLIYLDKRDLYLMPGLEEEEINDCEDVYFSKLQQLLNHFQRYLDIKRFIDH